MRAGSRCGRHPAPGRSAKRSAMRGAAHRVAVEPGWRHPRVGTLVASAGVGIVASACNGADPVAVLLTPSALIVSLSPSPSLSPGPCSRSLALSLPFSPPALSLFSWAGLVGLAPRDWDETCSCELVAPTLCDTFTTKDSCEAAELGADQPKCGWLGVTKSARLIDDSAGELLSLSLQRVAPVWVAAAPCKNTSQCAQATHRLASCSYKPALLDRLADID